MKKIKIKIYLLLFLFLLVMSLIGYLYKGRTSEFKINFNKSNDVLSRNIVFSYADALKESRGAVVNINTQTVVESKGVYLEKPILDRFFGKQKSGSSVKSTSLGSGVLVSSDGYVVTNNHVITDADKIQVTLGDGRSAIANIVGVDLDTDLAILKINLSSLTPIIFADSDDLEVGDVCLAIGNPFGVGKTVTMGIVSATGRTHLGISNIENFIQTDAAINPGNSGGALINAKGYLIGINTAIFSKSGASHGIGFAIPTRVVKDVLESIVENGKVSRGWIGVETQNLTRNLAESFGLKNSLGVVVTGIYRNSPAKKSGILPGDVLISLSGEKVLDGQSWKSLVLQLKVSSKVLIGLIRKGVTHEVELVLAKRPEDFN